MILAMSHSSLNRDLIICLPWLTYQRCWLATASREKLRDHTARFAGSGGRGAGIRGGGALTAHARGAESTNSGLLSLSPLLPAGTRSEAVLATRRGLVQPHVAGIQWGRGAMSCARWKGARLKDVLELVGLNKEAVEMVFDGADGPSSTRRQIS
jgi:Oxidoreductase molybdopterin binding domain